MTNDEKHALFVAMVLIHYKWYKEETGYTIISETETVQRHLDASELMCRVAFRLDRRWNGFEDQTSKHDYIRFWCAEHYKNHGYIFMTVDDNR